MISRLLKVLEEVRRFDKTYLSPIIDDVSELMFVASPLFLFFIGYVTYQQGSVFGEAIPVVLLTAPVIYLLHLKAVGLEKGVMIFTEVWHLSSSAVLAFLLAGLFFPEIYLAWNRVEETFMMMLGAQILISILYLIVILIALAALAPLLALFSLLALSMVSYVCPSYFKPPPGAPAYEEKGNGISFADKITVVVSWAVLIALYLNSDAVSLAHSPTAELVSRGSAYILLGGFAIVYTRRIFNPPPWKRKHTDEENTLRWN